MNNNEKTLQSENQDPQKKVAQNEKNKCPHRRYKKETFWGAHSGDYICLDCGAVITPEERG